MVVQKDTLAGRGYTEGDRERCSTTNLTIIHHYHTV